MTQRNGIFLGENPFDITRKWLEEATAVEINDPNAIALATVDAEGLPNVRMVLLKDITDQEFIFYTNYTSAKGVEISESGKVAFVMHWKTLQRQIRVRGVVRKEDGEAADAYYHSRSLKSRIGAWASDQSKPLASRETLMADVARIGVQKGLHPERPSFWGGFAIAPLEVEFWADGAFRLHDRFKWSRSLNDENWRIERLSP